MEERETTAKGLEPKAEEFRNWWKQLGHFSEEFLAQIEEGPAFGEGHPTALGGELPLDGSSFKNVLEEFANLALPFGVQPVSGRFFGYIPGGGLPAAAVGDFLAALTNRYAGAHTACPGAAEIENRTLSWLREIVGFPEGSWGTLQSGGSLATLTALVTARSSRPFLEWPRLVVYHTSEWHHALPKALGIAGLAGTQRRQVPITSDYRMSADALKAMIQADRRDGRIPWLLCASAGTTNTGAVDPLLELGRIAQGEGLWFHVDGAYGGFFVLAAKAKERLAGIEAADSLVLDPHKGLFLPYGCGAVLVKNGGLLRSAMAATSDYLRDVEGEEPSPMDYSPELTRHFRGLRLWFALKLHGLDRFRDAVEEKLDLARYLFEELGRTSGLVMGPFPQLSVVTFRAKGEGAGADEVTMRLLRSLLSRGRIHASSTRLGDRVFLRLCVLCFRTHRAEVDVAIKEIRDSI